MNGLNGFMRDCLPKIEILTVEDSPELLAIFSKVLELGGATVGAEHESGASRGRSLRTSTRS